MVKVFIILGSRAPEKAERQVVCLSRLPDELKRALRVQWKTFLALLEDGEKPAKRAAVVSFLERCLELSESKAD